MVTIKAEVRCQVRWSKDMAKDWAQNHTIYDLLNMSKAECGGPDVEEEGEQPLPDAETLVLRQQVKRQAESLTHDWHTIRDLKTRVGELEQVTSAQRDEVKRLNQTIDFHDQTIERLSKTIESKQNTIRELRERLGLRQPVESQADTTRFESVVGSLTKRNATKAVRNFEADTGPEVTTATGASCWVCYFINGDSSGMTDDEVEAADAWLKRHEPWRVVDVDRELDGEPVGSRFTWHYKLHTGLPFAGGEVVDYLMHKDR